MQFHKDFPFGKGMWIWRLDQCLPGSPQQGQLPAIIQKLKENDISYVLIKSGDGDRTWSQFTPSMINAFHNAGIKVYSWTYNYGRDAAREAAVAIWSLEQGADGHVFDAEAEFRDAAN